MNNEDGETAPAPALEVDKGALAEMLRAAGHHAFGPQFFLGQLAAFARDRCPEPAERLPRVDLWLAQGEVVTVCHLIAIAPHWVAVAARDRDAPDGTMDMRTELIPYPMIARVTISEGVARGRGRGIGFDQTHEPIIVDDHRTPEEILLAAAGVRSAT